MHRRKTRKPGIMGHDYIAQEFSLPANKTLIYLSLATAVLINLMPFDKVVLALRPDFVALILLYWNIHQPRQVGMGVAFLTGLIMDVIDTSVMGQHALAYCLITFLALILHRRLRLFNALRQIPAVLWILLLGQAMVFLTGVLVGTYAPEWHFFLASVTGALCWPVLVFLLGNFRKQQIEPDEI
ncbi:MAG: rod shape-determining protein MreD [Burkholderiales bacterium]|nr:rod shape-determining protein MreD [Burkholderiales bacterium]